MKPICVPCQRFYRMKLAGFYFIEAMPRIGVNVVDAQPGTDTPDQWTPYKVWAGDLWECRGCGHRLVSGVAQAPIAEHYQPDFADRIERLGADLLQVNDC